MAQEFGAFAKEVALQLEINANTLRRWSLELEKQGYEFTRNEKDQRIYYNRDMVVLTDFQKTIGKTQSLEIAAKAVAKRAQDKINADSVMSVVMKEDDKIAFSKDELEELLKRTAEETAAKTAEILMQKFNDSIEQNDRKLMQSIRQTFDEKQKQHQLEVAAAQEEKERWYVRLNPFAKKKEKAKDRM